MEISQREKDNITILDIQGEIDLYNAPEIKDIIQKLIEPIFILIAVLSALPIFFEWRKRRRAEKSKPAETDVSQENVE